MKPLPTPDVHVPAEDLARVRDLYESGRYVTAYRSAASIGPLAAWAGADARVLAGRMAANLGAPVLAAAIHERARRTDRSHAGAIYACARGRLRERGPLAAWNYVSRFEDFDRLPGASPDDRSEWHSLHAEIAPRFRDFHRADRHIAAALEIAPENPWLRVVEADVLEAQDRYADALEAAAPGPPSKRTRPSPPRRPRRGCTASRGNAKTGWTAQAARAWDGCVREDSRRTSGERVPDPSPGRALARVRDGAALNSRRDSVRIGFPAWPRLAGRHAPPRVAPPREEPHPCRPATSHPHL